MLITKTTSQEALEAALLIGSLEKGEKHRDASPADELANGTREWWANEKSREMTVKSIEAAFLLGAAWHCEYSFDNGVTLEVHGSTLFFRKDGKLHREDGPAVQNTTTGYQAWWVHGLRHREDGPAVELVDGTQEWWFHGERSEK
jgi:hypothetical protein